jgi:LytS/YehU family sensor histidine kinase
MASPFVLPAVMSVAIKITQRLFKAETQRKEAENKNLESELLHLKYQLQPHFFFNSLNNIYSLVSISPEKAQEAIHNLSKLMRYLLYETGVENVKLSSELVFLKQYIQLMELRLTDKTKVTVQIPEVQESYQVAPLLFLPLIENAYKHSISATHPSFIHFEITITDNTLCFLAENSNFPKTDLDKSGSGIGLENLKKRLNLLYPQQHQFKTAILNKVFRAELIIIFPSK